MHHFKLNKPCRVVYFPNAYCDHLQQTNLNKILIKSKLFHLAYNKWEFLC